MSDIEEVCTYPQGKLLIVDVNGETLSDQAHSNTSCFCVTILYIHALDERNSRFCYVSGSVRYQRTSASRLHDDSTHKSRVTVTVMSLMNLVCSHC